MEGALPDSKEISTLGCGLHLLADANKANSMPFPKFFNTKKKKKKRIEKKRK